MGPAESRFGLARASRTVRGQERRQGAMHVHTVVRRSRRLPRRRRRALAQAHHGAVCGSAPRHRRCPRRPRRTREVTDRVRQDTRLRHPDRRAHRASRATPRGARPRAYPRADEPDRRRARVDRARTIAAHLRRLWRRRPDRAGTQCRTRTHTGRHPRSPAGPTGPRRILARCDPAPRPRRGRPDARHGLPPRSRADHR